MISRKKKLTIKKKVLVITMEIYQLLAVDWPKFLTVSRKIHKLTGTLV